MIQTLCCNSCGEPLEVPEETRFLKRNHCGQSLAVKRSETATFTEAIEQLSEVTQGLAEDVASLKVNHEIYELDRSWDSQKQNYKVRTKNGREVNASAVGAVTTGIASVVVVLISLAMLSSGEGFAIILTTGGFVGIVQSFMMYQKASSFQRAKKR